MPRIDLDGTPQIGRWSSSVVRQPAVRIGGADRRRRELQQSGRSPVLDADPANLYPATDEDGFCDSNGHMKQEAAQTFFVQDNHLL